MSKYTMELREIIDTFGREEVKGWFTNFELSDFLSTEEVEVINEKGIWNKDKLAERIIDHYYTREIGTDGIGQFILFAKDRMNELMETYAPIIYSASLKFSPLDNMNISEIYSGTSGATSASQSISNGSGLVVSSDTPQGEINKSNILSGKYASSTSANESDASTSGSTTSDGRENYTKTTKGNSGKSAMELINQYRKVIRAVNTEIIYELEPLFMGLY